MRTSIDFPDELFRHLKASAALQGTSLRDHVLSLIERGMNSAPHSTAAPARMPKPVPPIPTVDFGGDSGSFPVELSTNKGINEFLMREEWENHLNVMKYGRSSGPTPHEAG